MRIKTNSKYICKNCGATITKSEINGYLKSGFSLHHIACPECGVHAIADRELEKRYPDPDKK